MCVIFLQPGHYYDSKVGKLEKWYNPQWHDEDYCPPNPLDLVRLREGLEAAVKRQLMSDGQDTCIHWARCADE